MAIHRFVRFLRFVLSSDTHFCHDYMDIPNGDVFMHCGDRSLVDTNMVFIIQQFALHGLQHG